MIKSPFSLGFYVAANNSLDSELEENLLQLLENELEVTNLENSQIDFIAPLLHKIYVTQGLFGRCSVLRFISFFEKNSEDSIIEKYQFDKLVTISLDQKPPDPPTKVDDEKIASFSIVKLLIVMRGMLPRSIVRGLVSLFYSPYHTYKDIVASYICEAIVRCDDLQIVPEIPKLLVDYFLESGSMSIIRLLIYAFEKKSMFMIYKSVANSILKPLSNSFAKQKGPQNVADAIIMIMKTWPGLLSFGIKGKALNQLIQILPHSIPSIINIFNSLLFFDAPKLSVVTSYTMLLIHYLIQNDLIEKLTDIYDKNSESLSLLGKLTFYSTHIGKTPKFQISNKSAAEENEQCSPSLLKISQCLTPSGTPISISNFILPDDELSWDWNFIRILLTTVLPHNEAEAQSHAAFQFYARLINMFSTPDFPNFPPHSYVSISECIHAFVELLYLKPWGQKLLIDFKPFNSALSISLQLIKTSKQIDDHHPIWAFVQCFCELMTSDAGMDILVRMNMMHQLSDFGNKFYQMKSLKRLLGMIHFYPNFQLTSFFFVKFLRSNSEEVAELALEQLRSKSKERPDFFERCLEILLLSLIKDLFKDKKAKLLNQALNLLHTWMLESEICLSIVVKDLQLYPIIREASHEMFSLLLSHDESSHIYSPQNIDMEIQYWMEKGIYDYVEVYDKAASMTFSHNFSYTPSIVINDGYALVPPHLFGQLSQTQYGFSKLSGKISNLLQICKEESVKKQRAAFFAIGHFGSIEKNQNNNFTSIITPEIVNFLIGIAAKSNSYMLKGTLISVLSLIKVTPEYSEILKKNGFIIYSNNNCLCTIPANPLSLMPDDNIGEKEFSKMSFPKPSNQVLEKIPLLQNPLSQVQAQKDLVDATKASQFLTSENATSATELLSYCDLIADGRLFVYNLFKSVPLLKPLNAQCDQRIIAECAAKAYESTKMNPILLATETISSLQIPKLSLLELKKQKSGALYPEVYLSDIDFKASLGYDRNQFYLLSSEQQNQIRKKILE